jgi:hypothetical protein
MATNKEEAPELKTYRGNCHCGAFVYEVQLPEIKSAGQCNCSICTKKGYLWAFPSSDHFKVIKGDESELQGYQFAGKNLTHKFCPTCGSGLLAKGASPQFGLNVHCIQGLNTWELEKTPFDGAAMAPAHETPKYTSPEPSANVEGGQLYTGSCHCGAVMLALKSKPIDKTYTERIAVCNCSICERNAYIWVYPPAEQVVIQGQENLSYYRFAGKVIAKTFCKICGIQFTNSPADLTQEEVDALSDDLKRAYQRINTTRPVNLRVLDGFSFKDLDPVKWEGFTKMQPQYVNP